MRETCLFCASKHIAQAIVLVTESCMGYELHRWVAVGHLAEAETETCSEFPELADNIRKVRLALMGQQGEFKHTDMMALLKRTRDVAATINGFSEVDHMRRAIYPNSERG